MTRFQFTIATFLAVGLGTSQAHAQVIHVEAQATVPAHQDVHLGDVATISGTDPQTADALAGTILISGLDGARTLKSENILVAIIAQLGQSNLTNRLQISGAASCTISLGAKTAAGEKEAFVTQAMVNEDHASAMTATRVDAAADAAPAMTNTAGSAPAADKAQRSVINASVMPAEKSGAPTLSKLLAARIAQELGATPNELEIEFNTISPLLDQPMEHGHWLFRPLTRTFIGTVQFEAQLVDDNRIIHKLNVETQVQRHGVVLIASDAITRGEMVTKAQFVAQDVLLDRMMPTLFTQASDIEGLEAQRDIAPGAQLDKRDFKPAVMVANGETVKVIFISGGLKVEMTGRAMHGGKLHDQIQVRNERTNEVYDAVLIGKHLAVVGGTLDDATEKKLRNEQ